MINFETFLFGLLVISTLTSLATEALKKVLYEHKATYRSNTLVGIVSLILSSAIGVGYAAITEIPITQQAIVCLVALIFMSWLCAMLGYDKVIQTISQFKTSTKDSNNSDNKGEEV